MEFGSSLVGEWGDVDLTPSSLMTTEVSATPSPSPSGGWPTPGPQPTYEFFGLSCVYFLSCIWAGVQLARLHYYCKPWTTQKVVSALVLGASLFRTAFFVLAMVNSVPGGDKRLDTLLGQQSLHVLLFWLDGAPTLLTFSAYGAVVLFWAKNLYTSLDDPVSFDELAKPCMVASKCVLNGALRLSIFVSLSPIISLSNSLFLFLLTFYLTLNLQPTQQLHLLRRPAVPLRGVLSGTALRSPGYP